MIVNPGKLDKRIEVIQRIATKDADGYDENKEAVVHSCWAEFMRVSGEELIQSNADTGITKAMFRIRYTKKALSRKMFVRYKGSDYEITYINDPNDAHKYIELWCELRTKEG